MLVNRAVFCLPHIYLCLTGMKNELPEVRLKGPGFPKQNCHFRKDIVIGDKRNIDLFNNAISCEVFVTSAADG